MFESIARILPVNRDQNDSYEININGYEARKINEIRIILYFMN